MAVMTVVEMTVVPVMEMTSAVVASVGMTAAGGALVEVTAVRVVGMASVAVVGRADGGIHIIFNAETVRSARMAGTGLGGDRAPYKNGGSSGDREEDDFHKGDAGWWLTVSPGINSGGDTRPTNPAILLCKKLRRRCGIRFCRLKLPDPIASPRPEPRD